MSFPSLTEDDPTEIRAVIGAVVSEDPKQSVMQEKVSFPPCAENSEGNHQHPGIAGGRRRSGAPESDSGG